MSIYVLTSTVSWVEQRRRVPGKAILTSPTSLDQDSTAQRIANGEFHFMSLGGDRTPEVIKQISGLNQRTNYTNFFDNYGSSLKLRYLDSRVFGEPITNPAGAFDVM